MKDDILPEMLRNAVAHHQAGRLADAEMLYRLVLEKFPDQPDALRLLGVLARQTGHIEVAAILMERAIAISPVNAEAHKSLGYIRQEQGRVGEAICSYEAAVAIDPNHGEAWARLGNVLEAGGNLEGAIAAYTNAIRVDQNNAALYFALGNACQLFRQYARAISAYRNALSLEPGNVEFHNNLGLAFQNENKLDEAIGAYRLALEIQPSYAPALNNLGNALKDQGDIESAISAYRQALASDSDHFAASNNLGNCLKIQGLMDEAIEAYRHALHIMPNHPGACNNLANALKDLGKFEEAIDLYNRALNFQPGYAEAHNNLGGALQAKGLLDEAINSFERAIHFQPDYAGAYSNLGVARWEQGKSHDAIAAYKTALELAPNFVVAHFNLGNALRNTGRMEEAIASYRAALRIRPDFLMAINNLGNALKDQSEVAQAIEVYRSAIALNPQSSEAHCNLANALAMDGRISDAVRHSERAAALAPNDPVPDSNRLYTLHFDPGYDAKALLSEHLEWNKRHIQQLTPVVEPFSNQPSPERKIRIGYVSADLRQHVIGCNLLPLTREHDRENFEVFFYSNADRSDSVTQAFKESGWHWREIRNLSDEMAARMIRSDQIDILIDLSCHSSGNRLSLFGRKPAPVQATYLAYCSTTGVETIDYRISDPNIDPGMEIAGCYSEKTVYLAQSYWCYEPLGATPSICSLPALQAGYVTFGCLNNPAKVSDDALELWFVLLSSISNSRLILHIPNGDRRGVISRKLDSLGIARERVRFIGKQPWTEYIETFQSIDIGLDPFPYGGGISSCDALWMGVPVITLSGRTGVGRGGQTILTNISLPELIADTPSEYLHIAANLAHRLPYLAELRSTLRERMERSALRDVKGFTHDLEAVYRQIWREWCERQEALAARDTQVKAKGRG